MDIYSNLGFGSGVEAAVWKRLPPKETILNVYLDSLSTKATVNNTD